MTDLTNLDRDGVVFALKRSGYTDDAGIKSATFKRMNGIAAIYEISFENHEGELDVGNVYIFLNANDQIVGEY